MPRHASSHEGVSDVCVSERVSCVTLVLYRGFTEVVVLKEHVFDSFSDPVF